MIKRKILVAGVQLAIGLGATAGASAGTFNGVNFTGGGFNYNGDNTFNNTSHTFNIKSDGSYGNLTSNGNLTSGAGNTIIMNTFLDAGGSTTLGQGSNRVLVNGNFSGEAITLDIRNNGGPGASTDLDSSGVNSANEGISVAQVAGSSNANAFALKGEYVAVGAFQYRLNSYGPADADKSQRLVNEDADGFWDYRLQNAKAAENPTPPPPVVPPVTPPVDPTTPVTPVAPTAGERLALVPQASSYLVQNNTLFAYGQQSIATLHQRFGEINGANSPAEGDAQVFVRTFGGQSSYNSDLSFNEYGYDYEQDFFGLQVGGNWLRLSGQDSSFRLGGALSAGKSQVNPNTVYLADASVGEVSRMQTDATSVALTATWQHNNGFYVDGVVGGSWYKTDIDTPFHQSRVAKTESSAIFASVEVGYSFALGEHVVLEPQAQVSWQKLDTETDTDHDGVVIDLGQPELFIWRVGARALLSEQTTAKGTAVTEYLKLNYYGSEGPDQRAFLSDEYFATGEYGDSVEFGFGATASMRNNWSLYGDMAVQMDVGSDQGSASRTGWIGTIGAKWVF
ncbi:autotransporter outer membrane beta-barrel domain-containing protein [Pseudoxanthomonas dokdonensis]|uniref:Autotransporter domain-containing protein n=1 Tax=Pseudoxanthomonas dokdonensis TaxID=344882 RepID=A0A0R0CQK9_9GAMM|nr:autotransporter outer membrane beta-barrel domain-containing protein [Pseudoxanthomonas dokdonensis]KRG68158.1 hypothetical protein ABB29_14015 [Pseudoxanthomonas dokdonensis]